MDKSNKLGWQETDGDIKITKDFLIKNVPVDLIKQIKIYAVSNDITMAQALINIVNASSVIGLVQATGIPEKRI